MTILHCYFSVCCYQDESEISNYISSTLNPGRDIALLNAAEIYHILKINIKHHLIEYSREYILTSEK